MERELVGSNPTWGSMSLKDYDNKTYLNLCMPVDTFMELLGLDGDLVNVMIAHNRDYVTVYAQMNDGTGHSLNPGAYCEERAVLRYEVENDLAKTKVMYYIDAGEPVIIRTDVASKIKKGKKLL
jgi:hypothetical protein